jgi:hypothetical protein
VGRSFRRAGCAQCFRDMVSFQHITPAASCRELIRKASGWMYHILTCRLVRADSLLYTCEREVMRRGSNKEEALLWQWMAGQGYAG